MFSLYDNEGNQIQRTKIADNTVTEYEWDYRNRLVEVREETSGGVTTSIVTFQYDAFDRRTGKQVDADVNGTIDRSEAWVWDGDQVIMQLVDADGDGAGTWKLTNRYLYGDIVDMALADEQLPSGGIGLTTVSGTSGTVLWPLADHLGSVRDLVDSNGVIREHVVYDSFGNRLSESDFDASGNAIAGDNPAAVDHLFGYAGREWDDDVDLQYNRARWYDPAQGRWISQDPIGFAAEDVNLYRYVGNEATGATDPSGLLPPGGGLAGGAYDRYADGIHDLYRDKRPPQPSRPWYERQWWNPAALNARLAVWWTETYSVDLEAQYELNAAKQRMAINATAYPHYDCGVGIRDGQRLGNVGHEAIARVIQLPVKSAETVVAATDTVLITYGGAQITRSAATRFLNPRIVAPKGTSLCGDIVLSGGRSGSKVKHLTGPPNSVVRGGGERVFVTNDKGQVILDITRDRVKPVTPGRGFGPKRPPTSDEVSILDNLLGGGQ